MALMVTTCTLEVLRVIAVTYYEEAAENHIGVLWLKLKTHAGFLVYLSSFISGCRLVCICHFFQLCMQIVFITYPVHSATTWCVSYPQLHSRSSSFYGIPSLFSSIIMSDTTIMVWSVFLKFQNRKQDFCVVVLSLWECCTNGREETSVNVSCISTLSYTEEQSGNTFWTSFAPGIWSTSARSSHITKGKASYSVMVLWVTKSEMTHQKCTQKCTMPEPGKIKTQWYILDTHTLHSRPLSKPHNKAWGNYNFQLQLQSSTSSIKWITTWFESHWISHPHYPLHWMKTTGI